MILIKGKVDKTLFIKRIKNHTLLVQVYVDDIILGSTNKELCEEFSSIMQGEFEMSMMGKMNYFLGIQIKQLKDGFFINQSKYCKELLKKFDMDSFKAMSTPTGSGTYVDQDESGVSIDITKYRGCKSDRKSTSGTCHILGNALVSWSCKKQACVALSTAEAEYIAAGSCCAQILC
ncbi:uncharacterized mitochondrial protein AtMg00810-like [Vicia villosa]|uniref:uncharacterized mitochondrial protein AtMg00810-like n=1 Tax=Vicia villosa TaxID=3911 RepID=UPI00273BE15A|nr:uncharacterized mitochondrial protein AtMg00810-like [Vicia villosa]